jgi:ribosome-associated protein
MIKTISEKDANTKGLIDSIVEGIQEVKGKDIAILNIANIESAVCEYFIVCTGDSSTQVRSIASSIEKTTRKNIKEKPWHREGSINNSEWVLLDYVNVVVHVFYRETRDFYNIEGLWADAERTDIPNID